MSATSWDEDFASGDYSEWTVVTGEFTASSEHLRAVSHLGNVIYHASDCVFGKWYFELWENETEAIDQHVFFIADGSDIATINGYSISIEYGISDHITLYKWTNGIPISLDQDVLDGGIGWYRYNVTRTTIYEFEIARILGTESVNSLSASDNSYISSVNFVWSSEPAGGALDNIEVLCEGTGTGGGSPGPVPPSPSPPGFLELVMIAGVSVVAVVCILIYRRRH